MRAIQVRRFGGPEVLELVDVQDPAPEPDEVVVTVAVTPVDFIQTQLRQGFTPGPPLPEPPYIPGSSIAGVVESLGPGVPGEWTGRRVVGRTVSGYGSNAGLAIAAPSGLTPLPDGLDLQVAAALLDDGSTAVGLIDNAQVRPGEWVLVEAAAGGLGSLLVQLARQAGARVIGAARGQDKLNLVKGLETEVQVDYTEPGWTERVRDVTGGRGVDLVFDGVGGQIGQESWSVTAVGGRFSVHGASSGAASVPDPAEAQRRDISVIGLEQLMAMGPGSGERLDRALTEAMAGRLIPTIGQRIPLASAAAAHAAMETRTVLGKTLLLV